MNSSEQDAEDQKTAQSFIKKLADGIKEVLMETAKSRKSRTLVNLDESLADYRDNLRLTDDGSKLEELLWKKATAIEKTAKESAWAHRLMFSSCRSRRRRLQEKIDIDPDVSTQARQKRWEESGGFLNEIVNGLYEFRGGLAVVMYRAACSTYPK
jgi:hypothetical protein